MSGLNNFRSEFPSAREFANRHASSDWSEKENVIKLLSVTWDEFENVVNWGTVEERDAFFDKDHEFQHVVETGYNVEKSTSRDSSIRIEEPLSGLRGFNYIVIDRYEAPVHGEVESRTTRDFYFITDMKFISPSNTQVFLKVDTWTKHFDKVHITGLKLARGHWAHKQTTSEEFLEAPLSSPVVLTEPEPELPSVKPMISYSNLISLSTSAPRVCIATTADFQNLHMFWHPAEYSQGSPLGFAYDSGSFDDPIDGFFNELSTEYITRDRSPSYGGTGSHSIPQVPVPSPDFREMGSQVPSGVRVYSTDVDTFQRFVSAVRERAPHILDSVQAVFYLPSDLIDESDPFRIASYTDAVGYDMRFKRVSEQPEAEKIADIGITNELFGFDESTAEFAKVFTGQFAKINITDQAGGSASISVEELAGDLEFYGRASSSFPFLKLQAFINGVGGNSEKTYSVRPLQQMDAQGFESRWTEMLFDLDIPTFSVYAASKEIEGIYGIDGWRTQKANNDSDVLSAALSADQSRKEALTALRLEEETNSIDRKNVTEQLQESRDYSIDLAEQTHELEMNDSSRSLERIRDEHLHAQNDAFRSLEQSYLSSGNSYSKRLENARRMFNNEKSANLRSESISNVTSERAYDDSISVHKVASRNAMSDVQDSARNMQSDVWEYFRNSRRSINHINEINLKSLSSSYEISKMNGEVANQINEANFFFSAVQQYLGVQSSVLGNKSALASSAITIGSGIVAGAAVGGGPIGGAIGGALGVAATAPGLITGLMQSNIDARAAYLNYDKTFIDLRLQSGWGRFPELKRTVEESNGNVEELTIPAGYSLFQEVANHQRKIDREMNDMNTEVSRETRSESIDAMLSKLSRMGISMSQYGGTLIGGNAISGGLYGRTRDMLDEEQDSLLRTLQNSKYISRLSREDADFNSSDSLHLEQYSSKQDRDDTNQEAKRAYDDGLESLLESRGISEDDVDHSISQIDKRQLFAEENAQKEYEISLKPFDNTEEKFEEKDRVTKQQIEEQTDLEYELINSNGSSAGASLISSANTSRHGPAKEFGATTGGGDDIFGQKGLTISVERISKADEKTVHNVFRRYGYTMPGTWVDEVDLGQMSDFTYWHADDIWIVSPKLTQSEKDKIQDMFMNGVTFWENAERVRMTKLGENK